MQCVFSKKMKRKCRSNIFEHVQNKKFRTKAQAGQILIYVLAIIVFSLTLIYGYKAIKYFSDRSTEISYLQLENEIKSEVEKVKGDSMGSVKKKILQIPGSYREVCFFNSVGRGGRSINEGYQLISENLDVTENNMFLYPPGDVSLNIGDIEVIGNNCIPIQGGKITLRIESMGDHAKVSGWG
jgi:hypothetical protein